MGLDNLNNYYDPSLKDYRLKVIGGKADEPFDSAQGKQKHEYSSVKGSIADRELVNRLFQENKFDIVVNRRQAESDAKLAWA